MRKVYYIVYKVTNIVNHKFYIGMHKTDNLNDFYLGSGRLIKKDVKTYGELCFIREIIAIFDNEKDMRRCEKDMVVIGPYSYNLRIGGGGGFDYINRYRPYDEVVRRNKLSEAHRGKTKNWRPGVIASANKSRGKTYEEIIGIKRATELRKVRSEFLKKNCPNKVQVTCPHCGLTGGKGSMKRFHFRRCKIFSQRRYECRSSLSLI